jgi:hypothetical protein
MVGELLLLAALTALPNIEPEHMSRNARSLALAEDQGRAFEGCVLAEPFRRHNRQQNDAERAS